MRFIFPLLLLLVSATGCSRDSVIEGSLLEDGAADAVRLDPDGDPVAIEEGAFLLEGVAGDTIDLLFAAGEDELGRVRIVGLPGRSRVALHDIWFDEGIGFPNRVEVEGGRTVLVNGIRFGAEERVRGEVAAEGTVLAVSRENGTLLMRPFDADMPDLRVLLGTGAVLETSEGEPVEFGRLRFGDTISVRGPAESGFVLATQIGMPTPVGEEVGSGETDEERDAWERLEQEAEARAEEAARREESRGNDDGGRDRNDNQARRGVGRGRGGGRR